MARCLLALGSNKGDRAHILANACTKIAALSSCQLLARSRWHATVPIGGADGQGAFLNGALLVDTALPPAELAVQLQAIETGLGRERVVRWDARTIDIDMLLYATALIDTTELTVPHPRMAFRLFVMEPASEIAGEMLHPTSGWTLRGLLAHLRSAPRYVVVTAAEAAIANWLLMHLSQTLGCPVWSDADEKAVRHEKIVAASVSNPMGGVEFPAGPTSGPPIVSARYPISLEAAASNQGKHDRFARPALRIALEVANLADLRAAAVAAGFGVDQELLSTESPDRSHGTGLHPLGLGPLGLGPVAKITAEDPATVLQEAFAAVRCVWPDLECPTGYHP